MYCACEAMNSRLEKITQRFEEVYGARGCRLFRAPGRVNLIGEHTDYNDGFVLPLAIERDVTIAAQGRSDRIVKAYSMDFGSEVEFSLDDIERDKKHTWSNYVRGVGLLLADRFPSLRGMDAVVQGNVPIGSGLSSSAAFEVAAATAMLGVNGLEMDRIEVALLCQRAENEFVGNRCGIMDQLSAVFGRAGKALLIDCRSLQVWPVPIPEDVVVVVCDTMKRRELASSAYNARRSECEEAVRLLQEKLPGIRALRDVSVEQFEAHKAALPATVRMRAEHVVYEDLRVERCVEALRTGDMAEVGRLMKESHESLRDLYQVSCHELDAMVEMAWRSPGCIGARMTGAGFGGCTVNLVERRKVAAFREATWSGYRGATGVAPEIYVSTPSDGACEIVAYT